MRVVRDATADDRPFLEQMLAVAADWQAEVPRPVAGLLQEPALSHYVEGWPRPGDAGVVAEEDGVAVGAAWWRWFSRDDAGYGFVDESTPELAIGVAPGHRGRGVGSALLAGLVERAREAELAALSLSVERENPARRLYERFGFTAVGEVEGSITMRLDLRG